jgi:glycolate oxidase iron-sulfur subunit
LAAAEVLLPARATRAALPALIEARGDERLKVNFFRGCLMDELLGDVNRDTVEVLARNGCRVALPEAQVCCGAMHAHTGELAQARELARRNINAFAGEDLIVSNSGGCGAQLKDYGTLLAGDEEYSERARRFSARVRDFSEFLAEIGPRPVPALPPLLVTYHDSCHLALVQEVTEPPRELLRAIPGVELIEMQPGEACCGSGGTWGLRHPELSGRLRDEKVEDAARTGAEVVVTNNPGCLLHLQDRDLRVAHIAELLAEAYRVGESS